MSDSPREDNTNSGGIFKTPLSKQERDQIKTLLRFLGVVLFFVIIAALTVGAIISQLS